MDSHKLIYHPETVGRWMRGENIYPIEIEIAPSGACNHRCTFCALDYMGYQPNFLKKEIILRDVEQMSKKGLKSVICAGEGEPLLHQNLPDIVNGMKSFNVDVAMSTNGALFTKDKLEECLGAFTWVRYSVASMEENSYDAIQRGKPGDLQRVKDNLRAAVEVKKAHGLHTTLGVQCLLMPENAAQLPMMAKTLREIGVDYFTIKPYSQHLHSEHTWNIDYDGMLELEEEVTSYATEDFSVFFRVNAMKKVHQGKCYQTCYGLPFMTYIDASGNVWPCVAHMGTNELCYGNINECTFEEIWEGARRKEIDEQLAEQDINKICREACRLDNINIYLNELKHPGEHVNFI